MSTDISTKVSPTLHPAIVKSIPGYDDPDVEAVLAPAVTAFDEAYQGIVKTHEIRAKAATNPTWNEAMQVIMTDDFAQKMFGRIAKGFDAVRTNLEKGIAHLEGELSKPVESKASGTIAAEVRAHVKALATEDRMKLIQQSIDDGDHTVATAVLGAPAMLSGIDGNMQKTLTRLYHERHNPVVAKRLRAMQAAKSLIEERSGLVFTELEKAVGVPPHKAKALREAKTNAEKAFVLNEA